MDEFIALLFGVIIGILVTAIIVNVVDVREKGAISAHKGEIVCVQLAFKEERWECGEL